MSTEIVAWFRGRLPDEWFTEPAEVIVDREEITVTGTLAEPESPADGGTAADGTAADAAADGRIKRFREDTRPRGGAQVRQEGRLGCAVRRGE